MALSSTYPRIQLLLLYFYAITKLICAINWHVTVKPFDHEFSNQLVSAYIVIGIIGILFFALIGGPAMYWPYLYGSELPPKTRRNAICFGIIGTFFLFDLPLAWMEIWIVWKVGWITVLQGMSLFLLCFCFSIGFLTTWLSYAWKLSRVLQVSFGGAPMAPRDYLQRSPPQYGPAQRI